MSDIQRLKAVLVLMQRDFTVREHVQEFRNSIIIKTVTLFLLLACKVRVRVQFIDFELNEIM